MINPQTTPASAQLRTLLATGAPVRTMVRGAAKTDGVQSFGERFASESAKLRQGRVSKPEARDGAVAAERTKQRDNQRTHESGEQDPRTHDRDAADAGASQRGPGQDASEVPTSEPITDAMHRAGVKEGAPADDAPPVDEEATGLLDKGVERRSKSQPEPAALPRPDLRGELVSAGVLKAAEGDNNAVAENPAGLRTSGKADDAADSEIAGVQQGSQIQQAAANGESLPAAPLTITDVNQQMLSMDPRRVLLGLQLPSVAKAQAGNSESSSGGAGLPQSGEQSLSRDVKAERGPGLLPENSQSIPWAQSWAQSSRNVPAQTDTLALGQSLSAAADPASALPQPVGATSASLPAGNPSMQATGQQLPLVPIAPAIAVAPAAQVPPSAGAQPASAAATVAASSAEQSVGRESNSEGARQDGQGDRGHGRDAARLNGMLATSASTLDSAGGTNGATQSGEAGAAAPEQFARQMERALLSAARQNERTPSAAQGPVIVRLKPEGLGQVRIRLDSTSAALSVRIEVGGTHTRRLLDESMPALVESLRQRGVKIEHASVHIDPQLRDGNADQPGSAFSQPNRNSSLAGEFDQHANHDASQRGRNRDRQSARR